MMRWAYWLTSLICAVLKGIFVLRFHVTAADFDCIQFVCADAAI